MKTREQSRGNDVVLRTICIQQCHFRSSIMTSWPWPSPWIVNVNLSFATFTHKVRREKALFPSFVLFFSLASITLSMLTTF